jgi:hypothetical protein
MAIHSKWNTQPAQAIGLPWVKYPTSLPNESSVFSKKDALGDRPVHRDHAEFYRRLENRELILFYEYFHGDHSRGVGATHQTGWTALVAEMINDDAWEWE